MVRPLSRLHVWPIDLTIARASTRLDFSSDPADEIIAATSVVHSVPLLTRDHVSAQLERLCRWPRRRYAPTPGGRWIGLLSMGMCRRLRK